MHYNIYWVDAGEHDYVAEYIEDYARYEYAHSCNYVIAQSRAKAKARHIKEEATNPYGKIYLEFTDKMTIKLIKKGFASEEEAEAWLDKQNEDVLEIIHADISKEEQLRLLEALDAQGNPMTGLESFKDSMNVN